MNLTRPAVFLVLVLTGNAWSAVAQAQPVPMQPRIAVCPITAPCVPPWTSTIVVYVIDSGGAAIAGASVRVSAPVGAGAISHTTATDEHGVAHLSLGAGQAVNVEVSMAGFSTVVSDGLKLSGGSISTIQAVMEVDSRAIRGVLPAPRAVP